MPNAKLGQQGVDCADLHTGATALIAKFRSSKVVLAIRAEQWQRAETLDNLLARFRARKSLQ